MYKDKDGEICVTEEEEKILRELIAERDDRIVEELRRSIPVTIREARLNYLKRHSEFQNRKIRFELEYDQATREFSVVTPIRNKEVEK